MLASILDWLIIALMLLVVALGLWLHVRLKALQAGLPAIEPLITTFGEVVTCAEHTCAGLKSAASEAEHSFTSRIETAQRLSDELRLLTGRADHAAERLAETIRASREQPPKPSRDEVGSGPAGVVPERCAVPRNRAEIEWTLSRLR